MRAIQNLAAILLAVLGAAVTIGWATQQIWLVQVAPGQGVMVLRTALCFVLAGLGLGLARTDSRHAGLRTSAAAALLAIAAFNLAERILGFSSALDFPTLHRLLDARHPALGQMSLPTTTGFLLAGAVLLFAPRVRAGWQAGLLRLGVLGIAALGLIGLLGYALRIEMFYGGDGFSQMALRTALGMTVLGLGLWLSLRHMPAYRRQAQDEGGRITALGAWLLVLTALMVALPSLVLLSIDMERNLGEGLRLGLDSRIRLIESNVVNGNERAEIVANRPLLLDILKHDPDSAQSRADALRVLTSFDPYGFSAIRLTLPAGQAVAQVGRFVQTPTIAVRLNMPQEVMLLWDGRRFLLRNRLAVREGDKLLGVIEAEQPMPYVTAALANYEGLGMSGEGVLCQPRADIFQCFPTRHHPQPLVIPRQPQGLPVLMHYAVLGKPGISFAHDYRRINVIGAYAPVGSLGLLATLKLDVVEFYAPLRTQLRWIALLVVLAILAGRALFRARIGPLVETLVRTERDAQAKNVALEQSEAFLYGVFEQGPDAILVVDQAGTILRANTQADTLFGYASQTLVGKRIDTLLPEHLRGVHADHRRAFMAAPYTRPMGQDLSLQAWRADGSEFPVEVSLAPLHLADGDRVVATIRDVSERRHKETLIQQALQEKELMLGEIHHRVKNNLQIIRSLLDLQANQVDDASVLALLRDSQNRIQSMALIHQTLYESNDFSQVDFEAFLRSLSSYLTTAYSISRVELKFDVEHIDLPVNQAIPLGLIVNELVTNCMKYAFPDERSGEILIRLRRIPEGQIELAVIDNGVGLPEGLDVTETVSLGMKLVHLLAEQIRATVEVQRADPTRFSLRFAAEPTGS